MKNYEVKKIKIKTLSPLLIGQETEPAGLSYIEEGQKIARVNFEKFVDSIEYPKEKEVLEKIIQNIKTYTGVIGARTNGDLKKVLDGTNKKEEIDNFVDYNLENHSKEKIRIMADVKITAKSNNKPYIPGSSLKGAVQTALVSKNQMDSVEINDHSRKIDKKLKPEEGELFGFRDSLLGSQESLFFSGITIFANGKTRPNRFQGNRGPYNPRAPLEVVFKAQQKGAAFCEAIKPETEFESGFLFKEKGFLDELTEAVLKKSYFVVESELFFYDNIKKADGISNENLEKIICFYETLQGMLKENTFLLRLGHGSGFKSTSSLFCEKIKGKENLIDSVLPKKAPGKAKFGKPIKRSADIHEKIKSRQLTPYQNTYWPMGWIKINFE